MDGPFVGNAQAAGKYHAPGANDGGNQPLSEITPRAIKQGLIGASRLQLGISLTRYRDVQMGRCGRACQIDPTAGKAVAKPKTKGFPPWTEDELALYEAFWPIGTRERVMFGVFCFTGLRRGDAARLGKQHIRNGVITIDTEKTGTRVTIPVLPELAEILAAGPPGELSIIASKKGQPIRKEVLGNLFKKACRAAGILTSRRTASGRLRRHARPTTARR